MRKFRRLIFFCVFAGLLLSTPLPAAGLPEILPEFKARRESFTLYTENDKYFAGTDRHYTNGAKLTWLEETNLDQSQDFVQLVARWLPWMDPQHRGWHYKIGFTLGQNLYTPTNISTPRLQPGDRPYSAWLYGGILLHAQIENQLRLVEIDAGIIGPGGLGRQTQNNVHDLLHLPRAQGWANQLHNEPGLLVSWERRYRSVLWPANSTTWQGDLVLRHRLTVGNVATHAALGAAVRVGWRLPKDFGADLIRAGGGSTPNADALVPFFTYVFVSAETRAIARDITLDGNTWRASASVPKRPVVADLNLGFAVGSPKFQLTYTQNYRTREFYGQPQRDVFGSVGLTWSY